MAENKLLERITVNPRIFGGKPIIHGRRLAVEHVLGMLAAGDTIETILSMLASAIAGVPISARAQEDIAAPALLTLIPPDLAHCHA